MTRNCSICTFILFCAAHFSLSQVRISGRIINQETNEVIPFVNCYLKSNKQLGTISNSDGNFIFDIDEILKEDQIIFSAIGFKTKSNRIADLVNVTDLSIYLQPENKLLEEVVISSKKINPTVILRKALNKIQKNYESKPSRKGYYYRQINYRDSSLARALEAVLSIDDLGYMTSINNLKISIVELRKTADLGYRNSAATFLQLLSDPLGNPHFVLGYDFVRGANTPVTGFSFRETMLQRDSLFSVFKDSKVTLFNTLLFGEELVYVLLINYAPSPTLINPTNPAKVKKALNMMSSLPKEIKRDLWMRIKSDSNRNGEDQYESRYTTTTKVYVKASDYAIIKIESEKKKNIFLKDEFKESMPFYKVVIHYEKENKYVLKSIHLSMVDLQKGNDDRNKPQWIEHNLVQLAQQDLPTEKANTYYPIRPNEDIYTLHLPYHPSFWKSLEGVMKWKKLFFEIDRKRFSTAQINDVFLID